MNNSLLQLLIWPIIISWIDAATGFLFLQGPLGSSPSQFRQDLIPAGRGDCRINGSPKKTKRGGYGASRRSSTSMVVVVAATAKDDVDTNDNNNEPCRNEIRERLLEDLAILAFRTQRGFNATQSERNQARTLIFELGKYNPTAEPAAAYYSNNNNNNSNPTFTTEASAPSLAGKWTLIYTDAPDIISLENSNPWAELARIGQECEPPYIRNIIEWRRPSWADFLPFSGTEPARVIQKVVTKAKASSDNPFMVFLQLAGLQIETPTPTSSTTTTTGTTTRTTAATSRNDAVDFATLTDRVQKRGILPTIFEQFPINLQGPLQAPFGEFEVLYLDEQIRIIRTGRNFLAVNRRIQTSHDAWF